MLVEESKPKILFIYTFEIKNDVVYSTLIIGACRPRLQIIHERLISREYLKEDVHNLTLLPVSNETKQKKCMPVMLTHN